MKSKLRARFPWSPRGTLSSAKSRECVPRACLILGVAASQVSYSFNYLEHTLSKDNHPLNTLSANFCSATYSRPLKKSWYSTLLLTLVVAVEKQGYLYKANKGRKNWIIRWVMIKNKTLKVYKKWKVPVLPLFG